MPPFDGVHFADDPLEHLAGDARLTEKLRQEDLLPLGSRIRIRLALEPATPEELQGCLRHLCAQAGNATLMTHGLMQTLSEHALGNRRVLVNTAAELLAVARRPRSRPARREALPRLRRRAPPGPPAHGGRAPPGMKRLPLCRAADLGADHPPPRRWLVESLWAERAVGILGGEPKCGKSLLALDLAVSVASGTPCLRRFAVAQRGRVLLYAAEDSLPIVRERLDGIAAAAGLGSLDLFVITAPSLRLDTDTDRGRLEETVRSARPRLLVLDPFVRLHAIDENAAGEVAPLLGYLRRLERTYETAMLLVHHVRKGAKAPPRCAAARRCAAAPSSTRGAIPISTSAAAATPCASASSTARRRPSTISSSAFPPPVTLSPSRSSTTRPPKRHRRTQNR